MARQIATNRTVEREELLDFVRPRHQMILLTQRADGSPQASPVTGGVDDSGRIVRVTGSAGVNGDEAVATAYLYDAQGRLALVRPLGEAASSDPALRMGTPYGYDNTGALLPEFSNGASTTIAANLGAALNWSVKDAAGQLANGWQGSVELTLEGRDFERIAATAGKVNSLTLNGIHFGLSPKARTASTSSPNPSNLRRIQRGSSAPQLSEKRASREKLTIGMMPGMIGMSTPCFLTSSTK